MGRRALATSGLQCRKIKLPCCVICNNSCTAVRPVTYCSLMPICLMCPYLPSPALAASSLLPDSPAGTECTESFESLKSDFQQLSAGVAAASQAPTPAANRYKVMRKVLQWPGAFGLYCWAIGVLERCAVQVALPGGNGSLWCVLPVVSAVPQVLRDAALRVELAGGATGDAPSRLRVTAACALPPGLLLSPALLLPFDSVEHLLSTYGPEALAWRRLLARQHQVPTLASRPSDSTAASAAMSPVSNLSTGPASPGVSSASVTAVGAAAAATGAPDAEEEYLLSMKAAGPRVLYELYVAPGEEDELYELKMELLAAAGLGSVHFLTEGLETKVGRGPGALRDLKGPPASGY